MCSIRCLFTKYFVIISCHLRVLQEYAGTQELCFFVLQNFDSFYKLPELIIHLISCHGQPHRLNSLQLANAALLWLLLITTTNLLTLLKSLIPLNNLVSFSRADKKPKQNSRLKCNVNHREQFYIKC